MHIDEAKSIHLRDLLDALGHQPVREQRGECWYESPFRQETDASFKITRSGRGWYDHGGGSRSGGNILDFIMQYKQTDVSGALRYLDSLNVTQTFSTHTAPQQNRNAAWNAPQTHSGASKGLDRRTPSDAHLGGSRGFRILKIQPLQQSSLCRYLEERGITPELVAPWIQEMHYQRQNRSREYFSLAFANDSGGYELRAPHFKSTTGTKDLTVIGAGEGDTSKVVVFEGFIDFLSAVMLSRRSPSMPVIVLNSVATQDKAIQAIQEMGATSVHLYRDRDNAGEILLQNFKEQLPDVIVQDESSLYPDCKDLNDYLISRTRLAVREDQMALPR